MAIKRVGSELSAAFQSLGTGVRMMGGFPLS
jgi:hypothetical protein